MTQLFTNNAQSVLVNAITDTQDSITIPTQDVDKFPRLLAPTPNPGGVSLDFFVLTIEDNSGNFEHVKVTTIVNNTFFVTRQAQDSVDHPARVFPAGSLVELRLLASDLDTIYSSMQDKINTLESQMQTLLNAKANSDYTNASYSPMPASKLWSTNGSTLYYTGVGSMWTLSIISNDSYTWPFSGTYMAFYVRGGANYSSSMSGAIHIKMFTIGDVIAPTPYWKHYTYWRIK